MSNFSASIAASSTSARGRYLAPGGSQRVTNALATRLARFGTKMGSLHELSVVGRSSGQRRSVPVSPLDLDGVRYLVSPRGTTDWVLNVRAAGELELRKGRRIQRYAAARVEGDTTPLLRAYLSEYRSTVKGFFAPLTPESTDADFAEVADGYPVLRLTPLS